MGHFDELLATKATFGGVVSGDKKRVVEITDATTTLGEGDSGTIYTINVGSNAATTITLPEITATNLGTYYEFFVGTENSGGIDILTASTVDTTGDVFLGALTSHTNAAESGAIGFIEAAADVNQINLTTGETNGAGQLGSYIRCVAVAFSSTAHSAWQVTGLLGTADPNGNMSTIFVDRD